MYIKGRSRGGWGQMATYIADLKDDDFTEVVEVRSLAADDAKGAMREMALVANKVTKSDKFLYHASIRLAQGEKLEKEQWLHSIDQLESKLGFKGQQRIVWRDEKDGWEHYHVCWNKCPSEGGPMVDLRYDGLKRKALARELRAEFGLPPIEVVKKNGKPLRDWEIERSKRSGIAPDMVRVELTRLWHTSKTGHEFMNALELAGYKLAMGAKGRLVLIDQVGHVHGLARRIENVTTVQIKSKLGPEILGRIKPLAAYTNVKSRRHKISLSKVFAFNADRYTSKSPSPFKWPTSQQLGVAISRKKPRAPKIKRKLQVASKRIRNFTPKIRDQKGWSIAAINDWNNWGKKLPLLFFTKWPELRQSVIGGGSLNHEI